MKRNGYGDPKLKFHVGDIVYAKESPQLLLVVRKYSDNVYYCIGKDDLMQKQLLFFEEDLAFPALA